MANRKVYYIDPETLTLAGDGESFEVPPNATTIAPPVDCNGKVKFNPELDLWECIPHEDETNLTP